MNFVLFLFLDKTLWEKQKKTVKGCDFGIGYVSELMWFLCQFFI